jgi:Rrf2 family iron-sulfur cluster assembly transcriptional regulator
MGEENVRLSTKGRYAVMAMVDLAMHSDGKPVALAAVAERQDISLSYLEQLFARLKRNALVKSVRGPGGGYMLAHGPDGTRISDIILAVDEPIRATRCGGGRADPRDAVRSPVASWLHQDQDALCDA